MKKALLFCFGIILAMWVAISPAIAENSISKTECTKEGFFPNLNDCTRFYRCVDFDGKLTKFDFQCGPGTVWHPTETTCVYPWQMDKNAECFQESNSAPS
ncbi:MAG: chitin binding domain-containing protein [Stigonema ocellatum SAG 48.90 = DSM 106950]|nr:chitin binding domain-containing protein [Stigonema ocellatum SAG 48.90 = DSM 106950]